MYSIIFTSMIISGAYGSSTSNVFNSHFLVLLDFTNLINFLIYLCLAVSSCYVSLPFHYSILLYFLMQQLCSSLMCFLSSPILVSSLLTHTIQGVGFSVQAAGNHALVRESGDQGQPSLATFVPTRAILGGILMFGLSFMLL